MVGMKILVLMCFISPECTFIGSLCFGQNGIQTAEKKGYEVIFSAFVDILYIALHT